MNPTNKLLREMRILQLQSAGMSLKQAQEKIKQDVYDENLKRKREEFERKRQEIGATPKRQRTVSRKSMGAIITARESALDRGAYLPSEEEIWGENGVTKAIQATWSEGERLARMRWAAPVPVELQVTGEDDRHQKRKYKN